MTAHHLAGRPPHLVVIAKEPVPGRVKTRLCPPCTPESAALIASAALADTLAAATAARFGTRTVARTGRLPVPAGWRAVEQRGDGLGERLANAFGDAAVDDAATLLIGMDTPQVSAPLLHGMTARLVGADAVIGHADDGGWWCLVLRDPAAAAVLREVPMSTSTTGARTVAALRSAGLRVATGPSLRDVDTATDAWAVAGQCAPNSDFARAVRVHIPRPVAR